MKIGYSKVVLSLVASLVVVGCGGGGDLENEPKVTTGYFIDSAVAGADYNTTSGLKGTTDKFGKFKFISGDEVEFRIGKVVLGKAKPKLEDDGVGVVTPKELAKGNETLETLILQLLQSLDKDNNPNNGITIDPRVKKELMELNTSVDIYHIKSEDDLLKIAPLSHHIDKNSDGVIDVKEDDAIAHFEDSITKWKSGHRPDKETQKHVETTKNGEKAHENTNGDKNTTHGPKDSNKGHNKNNQGSQGNSSKNEENNCTNHEDMNHTKEFNVDTLPKSGNLTQQNKDDLAFMGNEERLAYDVYMALYNYHLANGDKINQLINIASRSETKHIQSVRDLVNRYNISANDLTNLDSSYAPVASPTTPSDALPAGKYDIAHIQELYDFLVAKGKNSVQDALEVGCMVEVTDINDLNPKIEHAKESNATDLQETFEFLRDGSYNHYWAFDRGLKNMGIEEGCCSLGDEWCHEEYPKNEKGNQSSKRDEPQHGKGKGQGKGKRG